MDDDNEQNDPSVVSDEEDELLLVNASEDVDERADEEPVGEGEQPPPPKPKPSYAKANSTKFFKLCSALEAVWQATNRKDKKKKGPTDEEKLRKILPPKVLAYLDKPSEGSDKPESIFPIFRLLMPDRDSSRQFWVKEKQIAQMYTSAFGLPKNSVRSLMMFNYSDPRLAGVSAGDFPRVVGDVVGKYKIATGTGSDFTVGDINAALDAFVSLSDKIRAAPSHDFKSSGKKKNKPKLQDLRAGWLQELNRDVPGRKGLSALEHKWLVRILTKNMRMGLGWGKLLDWYDPYAKQAWASHNSLKVVCDELCDPNMAKERQSAERQQQRLIDSQAGGLASYLPRSLAHPKFGCTFSPMLSAATGFDRLLQSISGRHRAYIESPENARRHQHVPQDCLAFRHPAFSIETKLDGEREVVHVSKDGVVKMHTRNGNWYSEIYSPVLGPALRRALPKGLDVILDGEVLSWDDGRKETIAFGNNRTIAGLRRKWIDRHGGKVDPRDTGMHAGENAANVMKNTDAWNKPMSDEDTEQAGAECWLLFVAFDVIYVDGEGAQELLSQAVSSHVIPSPGSLIDLDVFERKKVLYRLLTPQEKEVEIVDTCVVRPNGHLALGHQYFDPHNPLMECGYPAHVLDSLSCTLNGDIANQAEVDAERRNHRSDEQISQARAQAIQKLYNRIVEQQRQEGLLFKDLNTPYYLGDSKFLRYWLKFKPDYFHGSTASDLDVLIIGAYFATGLRNGGQPSALLCACVDSEDHTSFYPVCKVNLGSVGREDRRTILKYTGFIGDGDKDGEGLANKWFRGDKDAKFIPDFVSKKSSPEDTEGNGWRVPKKDYPDLWINPSDSLILTLNAGEIVVSDTFSAGITLRFPRITKIRDDKKPHQIVSEASLWETFEEVQQCRTSADGHASIQMGSPVAGDLGGPCRFFTESQYAVLQKQRRKKNRMVVQKVAVPSVSKSEMKSNALSGISFAVIGTRGFSLAECGIDAEEAQESGWTEIAGRVKNAKAVVRFIKQHGGTYKVSADDCDFVLGGSRDDPKVATHIQAIENSRAMVTASKGKSKSISAQKQAVMAKSPGVLRWTFVYSLVHEWLSKGADPELSIKETKPKPTVLDYVARPACTGCSTTIDPGLFEIDLSSVGVMRRALDFVNESKKARDLDNRGNNENWRDVCMKRLDVDERWVAGSEKQVLWPYKKESFATASRTLIYPATNDDPSSARSSRLASVLPLARVMGASIATKLDSSVTHILCDLKDGHDEIVLDDTDDLTSDVFSDAEHGRKLLEKLDRFFDLSVTLVSPSWVRKRKWTAAISP